MTDEELLRRLVADERLTEVELDAFGGMQKRLPRYRVLTQDQRKWADDVARRLELDADDVENLFSSGKIKIGREVALPEVLKSLPKRPPRKVPR